MLSNKAIIGIGAILFFTVATGFIMMGLQQRQATRPGAQFVDVFSCPAGTTKPDDQTGECLPGTVPVPVYPTGGGQQSIGTGSIDGGTFGGNDIGPTSSLQSSPTPTPPVLGFCCIPLDTPTPTLPIDELTPTPSSTPSTPTPTTPDAPTPTACPQGGEQLIITSLSGCSAANRCDFSTVSNGGTSIATRSLWSDGTFDFGTQSFSVQKLAETTFTYLQPGTYDVTLTCVDTQTVCTKQISITEPGVCTTPTPSLEVPTSTPSPTPLACRIPMPTLIITCPEGCTRLQ